MVRRELEKCQKIELRGEKLSEACVSRRRHVTAKALFQLTNVVTKDHKGNSIEDVGRIAK